MTHEPNSRRVGERVVIRVPCRLCSHCCASTPHPIPLPFNTGMPLLSCPRCPPSSPSRSQPSQPFFLGLNDNKCQTAGALTLHVRVRPELCLHTSIVSNGGLSVLFSIHPHVLHGITYDSSIVHRWRPIQDHIHHSAKSHTHTHTHRLTTRQANRTYTIRSCH
jgi:hypothetical protein